MNADETPESIRPEATADVGGSAASAELDRINARRYLWLRWASERNISATNGGVHCIIPGKYGLTAAFSADDLDAAIDAAMVQFPMG